MRDKVRVPVLALGGDKTFGDKTREQLTTLVEKVHGGAAQHCGHFIPEEQPDVLVRLLSEFWTKTAHQRVARR